MYQRGHGPGMLGCGVMLSRGFDWKALEALKWLRGTHIFQHERYHLRNFACLTILMFMQAVLASNKCFVQIT